MPVNKSSAKTVRPGLTCRLSCLLVIPILLAGCDAGRAVPMPALEPATITFAYTEVGPLGPDYDGLVEAFNELYPQITVRLRGVQPLSGELETLSPGSVDVREIAEPWGHALIRQDVLLDLSGFISQDMTFDVSDFYPAMMDAFFTGGGVYGIPVGAEGHVMYYSKGLFDRHGLAYPEAGWTWQDFLDAARVIRDIDAGIYGFAHLSLPNGVPDAVPFVYQHGGRLFDDLQQPTRTTFDDPLTIEAMEWYAQLYEDDVAPTAGEALRDFGQDWGLGLTTFLGVYHGQVGMWCHYFGGRGGRAWGYEWYEPWGMAPLPRDAQAATDLVVVGYAISSQSQNAEASWRWITFLTTHLDDHLMPARISVLESSAYEQLVGEEVAAAVRASLESGMTFSRAYEPFGEVLRVFEEAVVMIEEGEMTPRSAMAWAQDEVVSRLEP